MSDLRSVLLLCWRDTGHPQGGGSETYLQRVGAQLAASGIDVKLRTARYPGAPRREVVDGVRISRSGGRYSVYVWALLAMALNELGARLGIRSLRQVRPDVVVDTQNGLPFLARLVELAREYGFHLIHDLAYADIAFDGYKPPSVLEVPGAKDVAVEFFTLSKSYNMPGWRVGFMVGNPVLVSALARLKSYFDYGTFTPIQVASIAALEGPQECVAEICETYRSRRNVLVEGLNKLGWPVALPKATMFVWAQIPERYRKLGSLEFSKLLLNEAKVAVSPGIGFGDYGDGHVRFSLIENEERTRQALRGIKAMLAKAQ